MKRRAQKVSRLLVPGWGNYSGGEYRLWDRAGELWECGLDKEPIDRNRAQSLYFDSGVQVAVAEGGSGLRWVDEPDRRRIWNHELASRGFDAAWKPPRDAPGTPPLRAYEFHKGDRRLLLFYDHD